MLIDGHGEPFVHKITVVDPNSTVTRDQYMLDASKDWTPDFSSTDELCLRSAGGGRSDFVWYGLAAPESRIQE